MLSFNLSTTSGVTITHLANLFVIPPNGLAFDVDPTNLIIPISNHYSLSIRRPSHSDVPPGCLYYVCWFVHCWKIEEGVSGGRVGKEF